MPCPAIATEIAEAVARLKNSRLLHQLSIATLSFHAKNLSKNSNEKLHCRCLFLSNATVGRVALAFCLSFPKGICVFTSTIRQLIFAVARYTLLCSTSLPLPVLEQRRSCYKVALTFCLSFPKGICVFTSTITRQTLFAVALFHVFAISYLRRCCCFLHCCS
jgi:hypothetical protein